MDNKFYWDDRDRAYYRSLSVEKIKPGTRGGDKGQIVIALRPVYRKGLEKDFINSREDELRLLSGVTSVLSLRLFEVLKEMISYRLPTWKTGLSFPEARKELSRICGLQEEELELRRKTAQDQNNDQIKPRTMQDKETPTGGEKVPEIGKYARLFELPQKGDLWKELSRDPEGFKTSFYFGEGKDREVLTIPREGVTYICGLSSHFKSTLLRNLALQMTEDESQGKGDVH